MRGLVLPLYIMLMGALPLAGNAQVVINEIQVDNVDMYIDPSYNYGSWIELYNPTENDVPLSDMKLQHTDAEGTMQKHTLTALHGIVKAGGYSILWFDHNSADGYYGKNAEGQIPYKLDTEGGQIELYDGRGNLLNAVSYPPAVTRCSYARLTDNGQQWGWTSVPTPAQSNITTVYADARLSAPKTSQRGGVFTKPFQLHVTIPTGTTLYYTTDGKTPVPGKSPVSGTGVFSVENTVIYRFMLTKEGYLNSPVTTCSFIRMDRNYYLPIMSVTTHPDNLYDDYIGIYVQGKNGRTGNNKSVPMNQNMDWERPVNVEYMVPDGQGNWQGVLSQGALMSIFGGWTRFNDGDENFQFKPSFKLKADKQCEGLNFYPYPVFGEKPYIKNKTLLVRNGGQDQHGRIWDAVIQELLLSSGIHLDCQAAQPAHIFLNGLPLGMMNLREASNKAFAYSNYGIGSDEVNQWEDEFRIKAGDGLIFEKWYTLSQKLMNEPSDDIWQSICDILDVDEYCNYMAAEIYMGNLDWLRGGLKNVKGFCCNKDDGKIHVVLMDVDGCFGDTDMIMQIYKKGTGRLSWIFKNMMTYPPFRQQFIDAYCLMGGSVFLPERCVPFIRKWEAEITPALAWEGNEPHSRADRLCNTLTDRENEHDKRIASLKSQLGLTDEIKVNISTDTPLARILLNGREIPTTRFSGSLFGTAELTAVIPEGYRLRGWSVNGSIASTDTILDVSTYRNGTTDIMLSLQPQETRLLSPIRINEVSAANDIYISDYNKKSDWIELYNATDNDIDLTGVYLTDNPAKPHKYQLSPVNSHPSTLIIPAHGYKIVWCDNNEPESQLHAAFKLENSDSSYVCIRAADDSWADSIRYQAQGRWQSYGRFPDGADRLALFDRITIGQTNHISTQTEIYVPDMSTEVESVQLPRARQIVSIRYYNLSGQQISDPAKTHIFIRRIIYDDGSVESKKIVEH